MKAKTERGSIKKWLDQHIDYKGDECLTWPFYRSKFGYGWAHIDGRPRLVSRVICAMVHGEPPTPQHQAAHSCGKGHEGCVNPRHLSWKTRKENEADKVTHGTRSRGERHGSAKLTEEKVIQIRAMRKTHTAQAIADLYGVTRGAITDICDGTNWAHIVEEAV